MSYSEDVKRQFMVEFSIPYLTEVMINLIPKQKEAIKDLFMDTKLVSYTVSLDRTKVWALFLAHDTQELEESISYLPLTMYMKYRFHELMFHNTVHLIPTMSLN